MRDRITPHDLSQVFKRALAQGLIGDEDSAVIFYDLSRLQERIQEAKKAFPPETLHAIAMKANPLAAILKQLESMDMGVEVASFPELRIAGLVGFSPSRIVFDSPVKTWAELAYALKQGVHINADSFEELERIATLTAKIQTQSTVGVRINPQVGTGKIPMTSTAGEYSKFGISIQENRLRLIQSFLDYEFLTGVHLHIGSQGCSLDLLAKGVEVVMGLVQEIDMALQKAGAGRRIRIFDIGGGLPAAYRPDDPVVTIHDYQRELLRRCPDLFNGRLKIVTEFGRYLHANNAWVASRVEYVKRQSGIATALIHVGADMFLRKCYNPSDWHHEIIAFDTEGSPKTGEMEPYIIGGPLCFSGDILARDVLLPKLKAGDHILICDAGAYTFGMWSRYNSRQMPKVVGYYNNGKTFEVLKERESIEDVIAFWQ